MSAISSVIFIFAVAVLNVVGCAYSLSVLIAHVILKPDHFHSEVPELMTMYFLHHQKFHISSVVMVCGAYLMGVVLHHPSSVNCPPVLHPPAFLSELTTPSILD